jgi:DNA-binding transcriptional LysR family regulator
VLLKEKSVSATAKRLNLSQPAISSALAKLRDYFDDDILVSDGRSMVPTAFAEILHPLAEDMLGKAETLMNTSSAFDPKTSTRRFTISASDFTTNFLLAPLLLKQVNLAPSVRFELLPTGESSTTMFENGKIDLLITPDYFASERHPSSVLFEAEHVLVGCKNNPLLQSPVLMDDYLSAKHVAVRFGVNRQKSYAEEVSIPPSDDNIEVTVPNFVMIPQFIVGTHRIGIMHKPLFHTMKQTYPIRSQPLPFKMPNLVQTVQHHHRRKDDPGLAWLINILRSELKQLSISSDVGLL